MRLAAIAVMATMALSFSLPASRCRADDAWLGRDKAVHYTLSLELAGAGYVTSTAVTESRALRFTMAFGFAFALGAAKEIWDATGRGDPSWRDLAWDALGSLSGAALTWLVDLLALGHR